MRETGTGKRILTVVSVLAIVCGTLVWKTRGAGGADAASPIPIEERTTSGHNAVTEIASSPTRSALALSGLTVDRDGTRIHGVQVRVSLAGETHGVTSDGDGQFVVSFGSGRSSEIEVHCEDPSGAHEPCTAILQAHDWGAMHTFTLERREAVLLKVMDRASGEPVLRYGIRWSTDVLKLALGGPEGATQGKPVVENAGLHEGGMIRLPVSMVGARARIIPEDTTYAVSEVVLVEKSALAAALVVPLDRKATVVVDVEGPAQLRGGEVLVRLLKTFGTPGPIEQIVPVEASTSLFVAAARLGGFFEEWEVATTTVGASTKLHGPLGGAGFCVVAKCGTSANAERVALAPLVDPTRVRILFGSGARILGSLTPKEAVTDPHTFDCVEFGPPAWRRAGIVVAKVDPSDGSLTWLPKPDFFVSVVSLTPHAAPLYQQDARALGACPRAIARVGAAPFRPASSGRSLATQPGHLRWRWPLYYPVYWRRERS